MLQVLYGVNQRLRTEDVDSPLCNIRPVKTVMLVVLTGDRGLCGGYNNFILKKVGLRECGAQAGVRVGCGLCGQRLAMVNACDSARCTKQ